MIGKGHRIAAYTQSPEYLAKHGSFLKSCTATGQFQVLPGFSESTLPALVSRHTGCITGTGNTIPKTIRRLWDKSVAGLQGDSKALAEAMELQDRVAEADWTIVKAGIQGTVSIQPIPTWQLLTYLLRNTSLTITWRRVLAVPSDYLLVQSLMMLRS